MLATILQVLVYLTSLVLIGLVSAQTTKSEGLSGAIGGGVQSSTRYLPGSEEVLQNYTTWAATAWMLSCFLWFLVSNHTIGGR